VNYLEAHEEAVIKMKKHLKKSPMLDRLLKEIKDNTDLGNKYLIEKCEDIFPDITKSIQHRRAQYYLLLHEYHFVEHMHKEGTIESKDAEVLKSAIDKKIYNLNRHPPSIEVLKWKERLIKYSELTDIFEHNDLHKGLDPALEEKKII